MYYHMKVHFIKYKHSFKKEYTYSAYVDKSCNMFDFIGIIMKRMMKGDYAIFSTNNKHPYINTSNLDNRTYLQNIFCFLKEVIL